MHGNNNTNTKEIDFFLKKKKDTMATTVHAKYA